MTILTFFVVLLALVLVHEFGHFIAAKWAKMKVEEFAFGFPPRLFSKKYGETEYSFNALPLGGYVKISGEDPRDVSAGEGSFSKKSRIKQAIVVLAGVIGNLLFAWAVLSLVFLVGARLSTDAAPENALIKDVSLVVTRVLEDSPAALSGVEIGDRIMAIRGVEDFYEKTTPEDASAFISARAEKPLTFFLKSARGKEKELVILPYYNEEAGKKIIGVSLDEVGTVTLPFFSSVIEGGKLTARYTLLTGEAILNFFKEAFFGKAEIENLTGPVGVAGLVGKASSAGLSPLLVLTAIISINLALFNLLPLPALDGGRLLFIGIESLIRRPIAPAVYGVWNLMGFFLIIGLVLIVTYHDLVKIL